MAGGSGVWTGYDRACPGYVGDVAGYGEGADQMRMARLAMHLHLQNKDIDYFFDACNVYNSSVGQLFITRKVEDNDDL